MNILQLSWKNITSKPLAALLSLILLALGVGLISFLLLLNQQTTEKFERNQGGVDLVLGAKGSPLQLILSSIYHIDNPNGNIPIKSVQPFMNPKHPLIKKAIPMALGDSYKTYRIVGTNHEYVDIYEGEINSGRLWDGDFEVVIGAKVAEMTGLKFGDTFHSAHGLGETVSHHHEHDFRVAGILKKNNTVLDQLILTDMRNVWLAHAPHGDEGHSHDLIEAEQDITSLLVFYKNRTDLRTLNFPRSINKNTDILAANPAYETARLFEMMGIAERALRFLAFAIVFVSALSVFISLYKSLKDRRYELAIMRVMGSSRSKLFGLITLEGVLLALVGGFLGIVLAHISMSVLARYMQDAYQYSFTGWQFLPEELYLIIGALLIGFVAAIIPAIQASNTDAAEMLQ